MKASVVAAARIENATEELRPEFRRATANMKLCASALERLFEQAPALDRRSCGLVLGTSFGELETTSDFLGTLAAQGVARPLLFQNSLHNATTGFLSLHFKMQGPTATLCDRAHAGHYALTTALLWLEAGLTDWVIAIECDTPVPALPHEPLPRAGAAAALLTRSDDEGRLTVELDARATAPPDPLGWLASAPSGGRLKLPFAP
ncbi:MAG TPA: beta-ketoacyl synthase chain length factor [Bdellovibrionales bacterium]|nr:beta-ketoacyl synthase chain length factor [Bdellovibrionales bacterium]